MDQIELDVNDVVNSLIQQNGNLSRDKAVLEAQVSALMKKLGELAENENSETEAQ